MKHTFKYDGLTTTVEAHTKRLVCVKTHEDCTGILVHIIFFPAELCGVIAQAIELTGESLMNTDKPLINAQALEAAKSFGEGLTV